MVGICSLAWWVYAPSMVGICFPSMVGEGVPSMVGEGVPGMVGGEGVHRVEGTLYASLGG